MLSEAAEFVIQGIAVEGGTFQQEDWAERLCNALARGSGWAQDVFFVCPSRVTDGIKSCSAGCIAGSQSRAFDMIKRYIAENRLMVRSGRGSRDAEASGSFPVIGKERRDRSATSGNFVYAFRAGKA